MIEHTDEEGCPACREAEKLDLTDEQTELFHKLVDAELDVSNAMYDLEESGVDMDNGGIEDALMAAVTSVLTANEKHTLN